MTTSSILSARLDRLPATRTVWTIVGLLSLAFFFELYDMLLSGYIAPGLVRGGIFTTTTAGVFGTQGVAAFIAALFAGLTVGTLIAGAFNDRFGRRAVFTWALLGYTAASVAMAFQHSATAINAFRFCAGIGLGVEMITIDTYICELVPSHVRGRAIALSQAIGFIAVPVVAVLSWILVPLSPLGLDGWRWVVLIGATSAIAVWYIRRRLPESPRWLAQKGRFAEAEAIVAALERRVEQEHGAPLPPPSADRPSVERGRFGEMFRPPYRRRTTMMIVFNICQTIGYYGFTNWVPTLLIEHGISVTKSMAYTAIIALSAPVGPMLGLAIGDRFERKWIIVAAAATVVLAGGVFAAATSAALLILMGIVLTVAGNTISFAYHAYQAEIFPTRIRAKAIGFVYAFSRMSAMINAFLIAFVLRQGGVASVFGFIGAAYLIAIVAIGVFGPRTANRSLEEIAA
ncbi:MFS transporter [Sphingomonas sp. PB2P12]|uniref:MFS transporter n=1 Tax=Sphingomonas sandaracina TaxID=3096157 RepID=UPI002FCC1EE8